MELTKKTTILFPPELHRRLSKLAADRGTSLGALVREACEREYSVATAAERIDAVRRLAALELPIGTPEEMARESIPDPDELMP